MSIIPLEAPNPHEVAVQGFITQLRAMQQAIPGYTFVGTQTQASLNATAAVSDRFLELIGLAWDWWNKDARHVGAPWLVDRDGKIFRTFDDRGWVYHLGLENTNGRYDRQSVAIELANELGLSLDICARHHIEPTFYYPSTTYDYSRCFEVAIIVCHSNCRKDKTDLCLPEWVYEKIRAAGIRLVS